MKVYTTNYFDTFIEVAEDTQANAFTAHLILCNGTHYYIFDYGF